MSTKITLTFNAESETVDAALIRNTIRRAFTNADLQGTEGEVKGIKFQVKARKSAPATEAAVIRAWARQEGLPVGKRGRIHPDLKKQYADAH